MRSCFQDRQAVLKPEGPLQLHGVFEEERFFEEAIDFFGEGVENSSNKRGSSSNHENFLRRRTWFSSMFEDRRTLLYLRFSGPKIRETPPYLIFRAEDRRRLASIFFIRVRRSKNPSIFELQGEDYIEDRRCPRDKIEDLLSSIFRSEAKTGSSLRYLGPKIEIPLYFNFRDQK